MEHENNSVDKSDLFFLKQDTILRLEWNKLAEYLSNYIKENRAWQIYGQDSAWLGIGRGKFKMFMLFYCICPFSNT